MCSRIIPVILSLLISFAAPCKETYTIEIPRTIEVNENGEINVNIIENNLAENEELNIVFAENFTLSDAHGKQDINGTMNEQKITFSHDDLQSKSVTYTVEQIPVGEWQGNMNINISLQRNLPSNVLLPGYQLNEIFKKIRPNVVTFTHQSVEADYDYDISLAQDKSILLYIIDEEEVLISNNRPLPITANEDMAGAFKGVESLLEVNDIDLIDFSPCLSISEIFADDIYLQQIDGIENIDTSNIADMSFAFKDNRSLSALDLSDWNVSRLLTSKAMFNNCTSLATVDLENWDPAALQDISYMFAGCSNLSSTDVSGFSNCEFTDLSHLFYGCSKLPQLDLSGWQLGECNNLSSAFTGCRSLTGIGDLSGWDTSKVTDFSKLFDSCKLLRNIGDLSGWDTSSSENMENMFANCTALTSLGDLSNWDLSKAQSLKGMFSYDSALTSIGNPGNWNVSDQCHDLSGLFMDSLNLLPSSLDLSSWDVSGVNDMSAMFRNCFSLEYLQISGWDTGELISASSMFECNQSNKTSKLKTITGIEGLDVSKVQDLSRAFYGNRYLNGDLSGWNTASLKDISYMLSGAWRFDINKLESWDISQLEDMSEAFGNNAGRMVSSNPPSWYH